MNNFGKYYTPEEYIKSVKGTEIEEQHTLEELKNKLNNTGLCEVCESEEVWKLADVGMCFTCTTGESDASEDTELH